MDINLAMNGLTQMGTEWILWLLVSLSVVGVGVIVERGVYFWSTRGRLTAFAEEVESLTPGRPVERLRKQLEEKPNQAAQVAAVGLGKANARSADEFMLGAMERTRLEMERYLGFLATVGSNAPFVGLLGTVVGIVGAFRELDKSGGALTEGLMSEVGEALIATAVGLLVALPAIAAFNVFRRIVQARLSEMDSARRLVLGGLSQLKGGD